MNKCLVVAVFLLFAGYSLVGSNNEEAGKYTVANQGHGSIEAEAPVDHSFYSEEEAGTQKRNFELPAQVFNVDATAGAHAANPRPGLSDFSYRSTKAISRYGRNLSTADSDTLKGTGCCCLVMAVAAAAITCGVVYAGHATRVYDRTGDALNVYYRPGCTRTWYTYDKDGTKIKHTQTIDCVKYIYPNNHCTIYNLGQLTKLCVTKANGYGSNMACATDEGLKHDYNWYAHKGTSGNLILTRGTNHPVPTQQPTFEPSLHESFDTQSHGNLRGYWNGVESEYISDVSAKLVEHDNLRGSQEK